MKHRPPYRTIVTENFARALLREMEEKGGKMVMCTASSLHGTIEWTSPALRLTVRAIPPPDPWGPCPSHTRPVLHGLDLFLPICSLAHSALDDLKLRLRQQEALRAMLKSRREYTAVLAFAEGLLEKYGTAHYPDLSLAACDEIIEWAKQSRN